MAAHEGVERGHVTRLGERDEGFVCGISGGHW